MQLAVRPAKAGDGPDVFRLLSQLWPEKSLSEDATQAAFQQGLTLPTEVYIIASLDDWIVGFASISLENSLYHSGQLAWVEALVTDKDVRGQGVGAALMDRVIEEAINRQCKAVEIMIDNQANAVKFVKAKGFLLRGNAFELKLTIPR